MFSISNTTKQKPLSSEEDFFCIKNEVLGKDYELSLVFVGDKKSQKLNWQFRKKTYTPNVLSFPIDKKTGEIFINLKVAKKESPEFEMTEKNYIKFLFVHGCLHLKGLDHGPKMEKEEAKFIKKFKLDK